MRVNSLDPSGFSWGLEGKREMSFHGTLVFEKNSCVFLKKRSQGRGGVWSEPSVAWWRRCGEAAAHCWPWFRGGLTGVSCSSGFTPGTRAKFLSQLSSSRHCGGHGRPLRHGRVSSPLLAGQAAGAVPAGAWGCVGVSRPCASSALTEAGGARRRDSVPGEVNRGLVRGPICRSDGLRFPRGCPQVQQ